MESKGHQRIKDRIDSLTSWEKTIARIDELNDLLLDALKERSRFPVAREYFDISLRKGSQKVLESKGIDTLQWKTLYSKIVEKICPEGDYAEGVLEAEAKLEELVYERIYIGKKVVEYKRQKGMDITRKEREEEIIRHVRDHASKNSMDPDAVEDVFRMIIDKNKYVQSLDKRSK